VLFITGLIGLFSLCVFMYVCVEFRCHGFYTHQVFVRVFVY